MRYPYLALMAALTVFPGMASAQTAPATPTSPAAAAPAHAPYTTADTELGTLLDDPAAKAVLVKHVPAMVGNEQIDQARGMTLQSLQAYAGEMLTDEILKKIDTDLATLPKAK